MPGDGLICAVRFSAPKRPISLRCNLRKFVYNASPHVRVPCSEACALCGSNTSQNYIDASCPRSPDSRHHLLVYSSGHLLSYYGTHSYSGCRFASWLTYKTGSHPQFYPPSPSPSTPSPWHVATMPSEPRSSSSPDRCRSPRAGRARCNMQGCATCRIRKKVSLMAIMIESHLHTF